MKFWTSIIMIVLVCAAALLTFSLGLPIDDQSKHNITIALAFMVGALMIVWMFKWYWGGI